MVKICHARAGCLFLFCFFLWLGHMVKICHARAGYAGPFVWGACAYPLPGSGYFFFSPEPRSGSCVYISTCRYVVFASSSSCVYAYMYIYTYMCVYVCTYVHDVHINIKYTWCMYVCRLCKFSRCKHFVFLCPNIFSLHKRANPRDPPYTYMLSIDIASWFVHPLIWRDTYVHIMHLIRTWCTHVCTHNASH